MNGATTLGDQARAMLAAYERLASLAEEIEDEWTYVTDLSAAWRGRIEELIDERGSGLRHLARRSGHRPCHR